MRQFFHVYETHVSGEFRCADPACTPEGVTLRLRITGADLQLVDLPSQAALTEAAYFREAATGVLSVLDPFIAIVADADTNPGRAKVLARRLIRAGHADAKWAHNLVGNLLMRDSDTAGALKEYQAALALDPGFIQARANYGDVLRVLGNVKGAREAFDAVEKSDPGSPLSQAGFADLAMLEGRPDEAVKFLAAASARAPLVTKYLDRAGTIELNSGHGPEAEALWQRSLEIDPVDLLALSQLALQYLSTDRYSLAELAYRDAADYAPTDASLQGQDAELLIMVRQYDAALARADKAIALAPDVADYRVSRASALQYLNRYDEALAELSTADAIAPANARISYAEGTMLQFLGRNEEAIAAFQRFLERDPDLLFRPAVEGWIRDLEQKPAAPDQPADG